MNTNKKSDDSKQFHEDFREQINEYEHALKEDEEFCSKDINATFKYLKDIEEKFLQQIVICRTQLEQIQLENIRISTLNRQEFDKQIQAIEQLCQQQNYVEAKEKFHEYIKQFEKREQIIEQIPKYSTTMNTIEQLFIPIMKSNRSSSSTVQQVTNSISMNQHKQTDELNDKIPLTTKEQLRQTKQFETDRFDDDNEQVDNEKINQHETSTFGILSKQTINNLTTTHSDPPHRRYILTNRLDATFNNNSLSYRNTTSNQLIPISKTIERDINPTLTLNPVSEYKYESNKYLLMACNYNYIVLFRSLGHNWSLGGIERGTHAQSIFDWHDGSIVSMGCIENDKIYLFTEISLTIYSILQRKSLASRILKQGTNDDYDINEHQRGLGTVCQNSIYHMYLNKNSHWTISKFLLDTFKSDGDFDLTRLFPDVRQFIHLCITKQTWHFLVEMNDNTYAVVYCYPNDFRSNRTRSEIRLINARKPLSIYCGYCREMKCELFFINDPSKKILHVITLENYFYSYPIVAHAIYYVESKRELMIVTDNSICSMNLDEQRFVLSTVN